MKQEKKTKTLVDAAASTPSTTVRNFDGNHVCFLLLTAVNQSTTACEEDTYYHALLEAW
jgi:hypothetical protein